MKKKLRLSQSLTAHSVFTVMSLLAAVIFNSFNIWWVFIDGTVGIDHFCEGLLILVSLNTVIMGTLTALKLRKKESNRILFTVSAVLSFIFFAFAFGYGIGLAVDESAASFFLSLADTAAKAVPLSAIITLAVYYPAFGSKAKKIITAAVIVCTAVWVINDFFPVTPYKFASEPMVIDTGKEYSVVFATNDYGTAYIEYTYEGKDYKVTDNTAGRLNSDSKIHSIRVPYEHLKNNTYKVGSTRVIDEYSYGSRLGKAIVSEEYTFTCNESDEQTYLVISDWHAMLDKAYSAIEYTGEYDAVILLGDSAPNVDFESDVIKNTVTFGGKVSAGTKPVIYVRGNHETRGDYANDLPTALGLEELYYTTDVGPYSFIVLDSGEDKVDSHREYGGLTDYGSYRAEMVEWMKTATVTNKKVIALSHAWQVSTVEEDLCLAAWDELDRIGTRLILSGHTHTCRLLRADADGIEGTIFTEHPDIVGYMDGGKSGKNYIASKLTLGKEGFTLEAYDNLGQEIFLDSFSW